MYKGSNNLPVLPVSVKSDFDYADEVRFSAMGSCYTLSGYTDYEVVLVDEKGVPYAAKEKPRIGFI